MQLLKLHHCSTQWFLITLLLCLMCNSSPLGSLPVLFCWLGGQIAECTTGSAGPVQLDLSRSLSQRVHPLTTSVKMGNVIAPVLQLGNLNVKWLVKSYTGRLGQSVHSVSFLEIYDSAANPPSSFLSESLKQFLLQFSLKSVAPSILLYML